MEFPCYNYLSYTIDIHIPFCTNSVKTVTPRAKQPPRKVKKSINSNGVLSETGKKEYQEMFPNAENLLKDVPMVGKRRELWNKSAHEITFRDANENNFDLYLS